jgi:hypothetical protein
MWKENDLWSQPPLVQKGDEPHFQAEPAEDLCLRERTQGSEGDVHALHSDDGQDGLTF